MHFITTNVVAKIPQQISVTRNKYRATYLLDSELSCTSVVKAPKFTHTTPIRKSLRWLKIN